MLRVRARNGVWKVSNTGEGWSSIKGERFGSALRRWRRAISTSPLQERDLATILGPTWTAAWSWTIFDFVDFGFRIGAWGWVWVWVVVMGTIWVELFGSGVSSGETFQIFRGRKWIFDGGDEVWVGPLVNLVGVGVASTIAVLVVVVVVVVVVVESWWGWVSVDPEYQLWTEMT